MAPGQEYKMGKGKEGNVDWGRSQYKTFYDDDNLNRFLQSHERGTPFKIVSGPTPIVVADKIAWTLEFLEGKEKPSQEKPGQESPTG